MFELDLRSRLPIYEQLVEKFKELIISEVLKVDEKLPSVRTLSKQLTINPNTIQKAYRELERQGYIYSIKGKGSFVMSSAQITNSEKLTTIKKELVKNLSEAIYLGINKDEIIDMISEAENLVKGGEENDCSKECK
ncbi:GntR family transcriptional regulator [Tepidibacter aestuarii]|uniref:GntR family transcriptional regulator n=1 Tax=Tepidibacter aestuarii TaxID=2925782 RepID=UPI0020BDB87A|nr:GntR family transcriptional regulator [Tepidibacter aestuarii]CAH2214219.1 transcriptional regulator (GntR family, cell wall antibiotics) [Tepidibacter aestuarii]